MARDDSQIVSFDDEPLILVDEHDNVVGHRSKAACHDGDGMLHRAFSVFVLNDNGEVLLQQRSEQKRLWPLFWTNSCCSHPRRGETLQQAVVRRVREELDVGTEPRLLYEFIYHARFGEAGSEHELCSVLVGKSTDPVRVNVNEIAQWRFVTPEALDQELASEPERFTPWFALEWPRLRRDHWDEVTALLGED